MSAHVAAPGSCRRRPRGRRAGRPRCLVRDLDRLGPAADEVEDGRQVGRDPEQRVGVVQLDAAALGLAQQLDRPGRIAAPGRARRPASSWRGSPGRARPARRHGRPGSPRARGAALSEKMPSSILSWASPARTVARSGLAFARDELDGPAGRVHRPGRVAGRAPDLGQPLVEQPEPDPVASGVEPADRRLEEGRRPRGLADREGRLRGADLEVDPVERGSRPPPRRTGAAGAGDEGQRELEGRQLVGRRVTTAGEGGGLDRRAPSRSGS